MPVAPAREWVEEIRAGLPELPAARRVAAAGAVGTVRPGHDRARNADALDLVAETVAAGATPEQARNWWLEELSRRANDEGIELAALAISPEQVATIIALVDSGKLNNKLARVVVDGVLAGEGTPDEVVAARGLAVVTDTSVLAAAVDEAIAANPDIAAKIADGKVAAAGALVGVVMKATRGQADAASVRELILQRCGAGS